MTVRENSLDSISAKCFDPIAMDTDTTRRNDNAAKKRYQLVQALSRKWLMRNRPEVLEKLERKAYKRYPRVVAADTVNAVNTNNERGET